MSDDLLQFTATSEQPVIAAPASSQSAVAPPPPPPSSSPSSTPVLSTASPVASASAAAAVAPSPKAYDGAATGVDLVQSPTEDLPTAINGSDKERCSSVDSYTELSRSEEEKKTSLRAKAQENIKSFYTNRAAKIEENRKDQLQAEKEFIDRMNQMDTTATASNPWSVVANHINFYKDPASSVAATTSNGSNKTSSERAAHKEREGQKDGGNQTRMKQLLQDLRKNGLNVNHHTTAGVGA